MVGPGWCTQALQLESARQSLALLPAEEEIRGWGASSGDRVQDLVVSDQGEVERCVRCEKKPVGAGDTRSAQIEPCRANQGGWYRVLCVAGLGEREGGGGRTWFLPKGGRGGGRDSDLLRSEHLGRVLGGGVTLQHP